MAKIDKIASTLEVKDKQVSVDIPTLTISGNESAEAIFKLMIQIASQTGVRGETDQARVVSLFNNAVDQRIRLRARQRFLAAEGDPAKATKQARSAMSKALRALRSQGLSDRDIQKKLLAELFSEDAGR